MLIKLKPWPDLQALQRIDALLCSQAFSPYMAMTLWYLVGYQEPIETTFLTKQDFAIDQHFIS